MNRKNELIKQYKQNPPEMGIIKIQNKINGKIFLGKAHNLKGKLNRYKIELKNGTHHIKELQNDFNCDLSHLDRVSLSYYLPAITSV